MRTAQNLFCLESQTFQRKVFSGPPFQNSLGQAHYLTRLSDPWPLLGPYAEAKSALILPIDHLMIILSSRMFAHHFLFLSLFQFFHKVLISLLILLYSFWFICVSLFLLLEYILHEVRHLILFTAVSSVLRTVPGAQQAFKKHCRINECYFSTYYSLLDKILYCYSICMRSIDLRTLPSVCLPKFPKEH